MTGAAEDAVGPRAASRPFDSPQQRQPDVGTLRRKYDVRNRRYANTPQSGIAHRLGAAQRDDAHEAPGVPRGDEPVRAAVRLHAALWPEAPQQVQAVAYLARRERTARATPQRVEFVPAPGLAAVRRRQPGRATTPKGRDRKSTRLNSSHSQISNAVFCLK